MAGKKRSADEAGATTRSGGAKTQKTSPSAKKSDKKGGPKAIASSAFKARATPLHITVTHTPPALGDDDGAAADPGLLGSVSLVPSTFATGSYGWKGSKRLTVELDDPDGGEGKEKVHVMLTINATVMGSKNAKEEGEGGDEKAAEAEGVEGEKEDEKATEEAEE